MTFRVEVTAEAEREADAILEWLLSQHAGCLLYTSDAADEG